MTAMRKGDTAASPAAPAPGESGAHPRHGAETSPRGWILYATAWIPFTLLYVIALTAQGEATLPQAVASGIIAMGAAAVGGVFVWRLTGRLPVATNRIAFFSLHLAFAGCYAIGWAIVQVIWLWPVAGAEIALYVARQAGMWQVVSGAWIYALIAGVSYLIRTQRRLRDREVAAAHAETAAARAQLRAIRSQLNPHFLFNSLHSLSTLIRYDAAAAEDAVDRLGELLRYALDHGAADVVRFRDELAFARNYLELEALRFGDRLSTRFEIDAAALDVVVPPFLLQPLVENAVRHGIAPRAGHGTITVRAAVADGRVTIEVRDDGLGAALAASLSSSAPGASGASGAPATPATPAAPGGVAVRSPATPGAAPAGPDAATGLGLRGIRQQLSTRYGAAATVEIDSSPGRGFRVAIALPARRHAGELAP